MAATQFEIDCALMAGRAYQLSRAELNWFSVPSGWTEFFHVPNDAYPTTLSFEAVSFQSGNEIVISYAGTAQLTDWVANLTLGTGFSSSQLEQAALYYLQIKQANPTATISFTGHSLGGGLAALMGVMFDERAITFDQAPFVNSASSGIRDSLENFLNDNGYSDSLLTTLVPEFISYGGYGTRTANVTGYFVQDDVLQGLQPPLGVLGSPTMLPQNSTGLGLISGPISLHSQALLSAFLLNDDFRTITFKLPELLKMVFDEALYAHSTSASNTEFVNFLEHLIRHQTGNAPGVATADQMLDRFTTDLQKVAQDGGFTLTNTHITNTLVAFAMQKYYEEPASGADHGRALFTSVTGGIRFDRTDVSATLSGAKGWQLYFQNYLNTLTLEEHRIVEQLLPAATDWFIQAGSVGMNATADVSKAFMVGGIGNDWMVGGSEADLLIGNAGDDTLKGGANNDTLMGGSGFDTYVVNAGDGTDTLLDSDGSGTLVFNGITLTGGALVSGTTNIWKNTAQGVTYTLKGTGASQILLISKDGSADGIRVQGWQSGQLGLTMAGVIAPPATSTPTGADGYSDALTGGGGSDRIFGLSGNDALDGSAGDDIIEGGLGDDLIGGNSGSDLIYGGSGRDMILFATGLSLFGTHMQNGVWTPPTGAGSVWTQGRVWGIYASTDANGDTYIIDGGGSLTEDSAGDIVFAGDDDDRVVGGLGDDYIDGGDNDVLWWKFNRQTNHLVTRLYN